MKKPDFNAEMAQHQVTWRRKHLENQAQGEQNGLFRQWILPSEPRELWEQGLWRGIRSGSANSLPEYLETPGKKVEKHKGVHNLKSSWMLCANLYFPFRQDLPMLAGFLKQHVSPLVEAVEAVELEYEEEDANLKPHELLGEPQGGTRGANQTSPDIAFLVRTADGGKGLILTENKLVEHSFYPCSGRKADVENPDPELCLNFTRLHANLTACWQRRWDNGGRPNRAYWDHLAVSDHGCKTLRTCPAATGGYQLFRQQALAEGIAQRGTYNLVVSCVAYDNRNLALIHCMHGAGIDDFTTGWAPLFSGKAKFATFTHQQWVAWVRQNDRAGRWANWIEYVSSRYGY